MKILCAVDFSEEANRALELASHLARRLEATKLILLHVIEPLSIPPAEFEVGEADWFEPTRKAAAAALEKRATALRSSGLSVSTVVESGSPARMVTEAGQLQKVDLLVVGTHGRGGAARLLLGSTAERIIQMATCPVVAVPTGAQSTIAEMARTASQPWRLVVGVDSSRASDAAVAWVSGLRQRVPCDVTFVHLFSPLQEHQRLGIDPPGDPDADAEARDILRRDLALRIGDVPGAGQVDLRLRPFISSDVAPLAWEADLEQAHLVVVGVSRGHLGARSMTVRTLRNASAPVVCIPAALASSVASTVDGAPMQRVLLATDLSPASQVAIPLAYRLLRGNGGVVEICHVIPVGRENRDGERPQALRPSLEKLVPPNADAWGIATRIAILEDDDPATAIVAEADRRGADVIVMASHGHSALRRALQGSVTQGVLGRAHRPVLVAPAP